MGFWNGYLRSSMNKWLNEWRVACKMRCIKKTTSPVSKYHSTSNNKRAKSKHSPMHTIAHTHTHINTHSRTNVRSVFAFCEITFTSSRHYDHSSRSAATTTTTKQQKEWRNVLSSPTQQMLRFNHAYMHKWQEHKSQATTKTYNNTNRTLQSIYMQYIYECSL